MKKRRFESFEVFSCLKKSTTLGFCRLLKDISLREWEKKTSSQIIHSLGGGYCWLVRDSEQIRLLKSPRSLNVYILKKRYTLTIYSICHGIERTRNIQIQEYTCQRKLPPAIRLLWRIIRPLAPSKCSKFNTKSFNHWRDELSGLLWYCQLF